MAVATEKLKPSDCVLAFGIPTCEKEFLNALKDSARRDLVRNKVWGEYDLNFVRHLKKIEPRMLKLGVRTVHQLTLQDFGSLFRDSANKVIILFSHWRESDQTVEFFSGMAGNDEIIDTIPNDFDGIFDLTVCRPKNLAIRLREHLPPKSLIKYVNVNNTAALWLYFYWAVFTVLHDSTDWKNGGEPGATYLEALEKAAEEFIEKGDI